MGNQILRGFLLQIRCIQAGKELEKARERNSRVERAAGWQSKVKVVRDKIKSFA